MGLPCVALSRTGAARWQDILRSAGYAVQLDTEGIRECEKNGEYCEPVNHPRLVSSFLYLIAYQDTQLRCLEVKLHDNSASLTFMPRDHSERQLLDQVRQMLVISGTE